MSVGDDVLAMRPTPIAPLALLSAALFAACLLAACGQPAAEAPARPVPDARLIDDPPPEPPPPLPSTVEEARSDILAAARAGSLRRLARLANAQPAFLSNFGGAAHFSHWDLMRRTGFDPNQALIELFDRPYATRMVDEEVWYIWPDLAALDSEALQPERLSFYDRARLIEYVGESGISAIRAGAPYPGIRTAISEDGAWRYFLHESSGEEGEE